MLCRIVPIPRFNQIRICILTPVLTPKKEMQSFLLVEVKNKGLLQYNVAISSLAAVFYREKLAVKSRLSFGRKFTLCFAHKDIICRQRHAHMNKVVVPV